MDRIKLAATQSLTFALIGAVLVFIFAGSILACIGAWTGKGLIDSFVNAIVYNLIASAIGALVAGCIGAWMGLRGQQA